MKISQENHEKISRSLLLQAVEAMIDELENDRLEVVLIPLKGIGRRCRRVVVSQNPQWYRDLCALYPKQRGRLGGRIRNRTKPDTLIKRDNVYQALLDLCLDRETVYTERLRPFVHAKMNELADKGVIN